MGDGLYIHHVLTQASLGLGSLPEDMALMSLKGQGVSQMEISKLRTESTKGWW